MNDQEIMAAITRLHGLLQDATDLQWQRPPVPHADKEGGRGGGVSDPTAATALDGTRLQLRAEVRWIGRQVQVLADHLAESLDVFNSVDVYQEPREWDAEFAGDGD